MGKTEGLYPSDLRHQEWEIIKKFIPSQKRGGRPRKTNIRRVVEAVLYLTHSGCAWRYLPKDFPPWQTVYNYFSQWVALGIWRKIHQVLAVFVRIKAGKAPFPTLTIIDGQSIRAHFGELRGYDGFKKVRGRKRQVLVDTLGLIWATKVHAGNEQETKRAIEVIKDYPAFLPKPKILLGDFAYGKSPFDIDLKFYWDIWPTCIKGSIEKYRDEKSGRIKERVLESNLKPKRWIVERTFAWLNFHRRLAHDYELKVTNSEAFLYISQLKFMLRRIFT